MKRFSSHATSADTVPEHVVSSSEEQEVPPAKDHHVTDCVSDVGNPDAPVTHVEPTEGGAPNEEAKAGQKVRRERKSEEPQGKKMVHDEDESRGENGRSAVWIIEYDFSHVMHPNPC